MTGNVINNKSILGFNLQKYLFRYRVTNITNPYVDLLYNLRNIHITIANDIKLHKS